MKTVYGISHWKQRFKNPVLAIGVFDGLHLGHQDLMRTTVRKARQIKGTAAVMTFSPHPVQVLHPEDHLPLITPLPYRLKLLENCGIEVCLVVHFTKKFSHLTPEQFIRRYIVKTVKAKIIIVGDDFRFGQDRAGTLNLFQEAGKKYGFSVIGLHQVKRNKKIISSTLIRRWITEGKFTQAARLLGRPVALYGKVVRGSHRGKSLGFPTANINLSQEVIPPLGVYAVNVFWEGKKYRGVANLGRRPSFSRNGRVKLEVHILNFHKNIYGKEIKVELLKKIRSEKYFSSREKLIRQIHQDAKKARNFIKHQ